MSAVDSGLPAASVARPAGSLRRTLVKVHSWMALGLGAYIVMLSVTGSAVVFRRELNQWLVPREVPSTAGERVTGDALAEVLRAAYPRDVVVEFREPRRAERPVSVSVERDGRRTDRLFDPYARKDLGESFPPVLRAVEWLVDLHDNLALGPSGRVVNGVGGAAVLGLIVTGAIIWWPGRRRVWHHLTIGRPAANRHFARRVHNALGVWSFAILFIWAATAFYFGFPDIFERTIDFFDSDLTDANRPGEPFLLGVIKLHFGRFGGLWIRYLYVLIGLIPAVLFATGFVLWWTRVMRRSAARNAE